MTPWGCAIIALGILLVVGVVLYELRKGKSPRYVALSGLLLVFAMVAFIVERSSTISRIETKFGTIDQTVQQISVSAQTVEDIKSRVENQGATVDAIARQSSDAESLSKRASAQIEDTAKKLATLDSLIAQADQTITKLNDDASFSKLMILAQGGDRSSYESLVKIASDDKNPNAAIAQAYLQFRIERT